MLIPRGSAGLRPSCLLGGVFNKGSKGFRKGFGFRASGFGNFEGFRALGNFEGFSGFGSFQGFRA